MKKLQYPFVPKSTAHLEVGHFWPVQLSKGGYRCGCVLGFWESEGKRRRSGFLAGLLDWRGDSYPTATSIQSASVARQGFAHIRIISDSPVGILGRQESLVPYLWTEHYREEKWALRRGSDFVRFITHDEAQQFPRQSTWGFNVLRILAEKEGPIQPPQTTPRGCAPLRV